MHRWFRLLIIAAISGLVVLIDQLTKNWFEKTGNSSVFLFLDGFVRSIHFENHGAIANLAIPSLLIIAISLVICGLIVFGLYRSAKRGRWPFLLSLSILLGGAIANLSDRIRLGYVRDWILLFNRSAINVADIAIAAGGLWFLWIVSKRQNKDVHKSEIIAEQTFGQGL